MTLKIVMAAVVFTLIAAGLFVRLNPLDVRALHVDPETAERPSAPGHVMARPGGDIEPAVYPMPAAELAARLEAIILATPRTERLAGQLDQGMASYVTRSSLWGFPDIASVKVVEVDGGASLRIFSRLRYGHADLGVNLARVEKWLSQL